MLNTTGVTVSARSPGRPLLRGDWTDEALEFSFSCTRRMDSYVGLPMIGWLGLENRQGFYMRMVFWQWA